MLTLSSFQSVPSLSVKQFLPPQGSRAEEVEQWLRRAVALAPNDPHAHKHLGVSFAKILHGPKTELR